jgi:branched-chain amino acid transport system ATP-binding protein
MADGSPLSGLRLDGVVAGYGDTVVIDGVTLALGAGETLAVLGRNGVGKTTLLATIMGHTQLRAGRIAFDGVAIEGEAPHARARRGIGWVPQEREVFPSLTVEENLAVAARAGSWTLARVYDLFPRLAERRRSFGNQLSGGEQQMLAVGRALATNPRLLLLDEPLEGLAPVIVDSLMDAFERLRAEEGLALLLVEQHARLALEFSPRVVVLERGKIVHDGPSLALREDAGALGRLLGVAAAEA